jgi:hypothetical protein
VYSPALPWGHSCHFMLPKKSLIWVLLLIIFEFWIRPTVYVLQRFGNSEFSHFIKEVDKPYMFQVGSMLQWLEPASLIW